MKSSSLFIISLSLLLFFSLPSLCFSATKEKCHPDDKKVLLKIKKDLNDPYILASWKPEEDCCTWYCLSCDERPPYRVTSLLISDGEVSAQIPDSVSDLPYLDTLVFRKLTNLTGQIPRSISKLTRLEFVRLSWTNLSRPLPAFFSELKNLNYLDLSFNNLTGTIPPEISQLQNLEALHLDRNKLTGTIPESFGNFKGKTPDLYLSHNQLTGTVPRSLGNLNFSYGLDFSRNKLEGDVSFLFGKNRTVPVVDLSRNLFEFDLSKVEFNEIIYELDMNHNKIYGSLPEGLTKLSNLQGFNVSYNRLCGQIPQGGRLQRFDYSAYFHNKCLCGTPLPPCKKNIGSI